MSSNLTAVIYAKRSDMRLIAICSQWSAYRAHGHGESQRCVTRTKNARATQCHCHFAVCCNFAFTCADNPFTAIIYLHEMFARYQLKSFR